MGERTSANGLPARNEDWIGEEVLPIDDARIPSMIREHGTPFRNPDLSEEGKR